MTYYRKHIFFCINQRHEGKKCCADGDAHSMSSYAKSELKRLGLHGEGGIRVSTSGCLGRCSEGPVLVIYPEGVWYTYSSQEDIDEIIQRHIINNEIVNHLALSEPK